MFTVFDAIFKFNTVFVTDKKQNRLVDVGFGARLVKIPGAPTPTVEENIFTFTPSSQLVLSDDEVKVQIISFTMLHCHLM